MFRLFARYILLMSRNPIMTARRVFHPIGGCLKVALPGCVVGRNRRFVNVRVISSKWLFSHFPTFLRPHWPVFCRRSAAPSAVQTFGKGSGRHAVSFRPSTSQLAQGKGGATVCVGDSGAEASRWRQQRLRRTPAFASTSTLSFPRWKTARWRRGTGALPLVSLRCTCPTAAGTSARLCADTHVLCGAALRCGRRRREREPPRRSNAEEQEKPSSRAQEKLMSRTPLRFVPDAAGNWGCFARLVGRCVRDLLPERRLRGGATRQGLKH